MGKLSDLTGAKGDLSVNFVETAGCKKSESRVARILRVALSGGPLWIISQARRIENTYP
jgi:hypothetical protein